MRSLLPILLVSACAPVDPGPFETCPEVQAQSADAGGSYACDIVAPDTGAEVKGTFPQHTERLDPRDRAPFDRFRFRCSGDPFADTPYTFRSFDEDEWKGMELLVTSMNLGCYKLVDVEAPTCDGRRVEVAVDGWRRRCFPEGAPPPPFTVTVFQVAPRRWAREVTLEPGIERPE